MVSAISLGVFCRDAPSTRAIILSKKLSPGWVVTITFILSESTFVPPVTELLSPPDSRITGADSPVMALSSMVAKPSMISPSVGITSPASHTNTSPLRSCADDTSLISSRYISPIVCINLAGVSSRVLRRLLAWALPRASAMASAKLANNNVRNSTKNTVKL